jgi:hypothetical protein
MVVPVQPIIDFALVLCALCDCRARLSSINTTEYHVDTVQSRFGVKPFGNSFPDPRKDLADWREPHIYRDQSGGFNLSWGRTRLGALDGTFLLSETVAHTAAEHLGKKFLPRQGSYRETAKKEQL